MGMQRALLDIEMLLDVRLAVVAQMLGEGKRGLADVLSSTEYYRHRQHDNFETATSGEITWEAYQLAYAARNADTLSYANMTDFIYQLRMDIKKELPAIERGVEMEGLDLYVNFYPYHDLTEDERDIIVRSVQHYMPLPAKVHGTYIPWKDLTVRRFENQFEMMAIYDHEDWLRHHQDELLQHRIPQHVIMTARISSLGHDPILPEGVGDGFKPRSAVLQEWVSLIFLPVTWVCYNHAMYQAIRNRQYSEPEHPEPFPAPSL